DSGTLDYCQQNDTTLLVTADDTLAGMGVFKQKGDKIKISLNAQNPLNVNFSFNGAVFSKKSGPCVNGAMNLPVGITDCMFEVIGNSDNSNTYLFRADWGGKLKGKNITIAPPNTVFLTDSEKLLQRYSGDTAGVKALMQKVYLRASQNRGVVYDLKDYREEIGIANPWDCYNSDTPSCTGKVYNESAVSPSPSANNYALALASFVKQKCAAGCRHVLIVGDDFVVPSYRISFDEFGGIPQVDGLRNVNTSNFVSDMPFVSTTKKTISDKDDFFNEAEAVAIVVPDTVSPELRLAIEEFKNTLKLKYGLSYTPGAGNSTNMIKEYFSSEISCNSYFGHPLSNMTVVLIGNRENNNGVRCLPWFENEENMFSVYTNPWGSFISQKYVMVVNTDSPTILKFVSKMFEKDLMKSSNFDMITFANTQLDRCSFAGLLVG
ncbi:MAG: hypothetical protein AABW85_00825, partial [archaeon]